MIPSTIAKIIIALVSFSLLVYLFLIKFPKFAEEIKCKELLKQGIIKKECLKYYSEIEEVYAKDAEELAGYIVACYYKALEEGKKEYFCYLVYLNTTIDKNSIIGNITQYSTLNSSKVNLLRKSYKGLVLVYFENGKVVVK